MIITAREVVVVVGLLHKVLVIVELLEELVEEAELEHKVADMRVVVG